MLHKFLIDVKCWFSIPITVGQLLDILASLHFNISHNVGAIHYTIALSQLITNLQLILLAHATLTLYCILTIGTTLYIMYVLLSLIVISYWFFSISFIPMLTANNFYTLFSFFFCALCAYTTPVYKTQLLLEYFSFHFN